MKKNTALFKLALIGGAFLAMSNAYANDDYDNVCTNVPEKIKYYGGQVGCVVYHNGRFSNISRYIAPQLSPTARLSNGTSSCTVGLPLHHVEDGPNTVPVCSLQPRQPFVQVALHNYFCRDGQFHGEAYWPQNAGESYELQISLAGSDFEPVSTQFAISDYFVPIALRLRATKNGQVGSWSYVRHNVNCRGGEIEP